MKVKERKDRGREILGGLDLERIGQAIRFDPEEQKKDAPESEWKPWTQASDDLDLAARMVCEGAVERWLAEDLVAYPFIRVQDSGNFALPGVVRKIRQVLDMAVYETAEALTPVVVIDWKAAMREVDARWARRQADGWQGPTYLLTTGAREFWYRGVDTNLNVREIKCAPNSLTETHIIGVENLYQTLLGLYEGMESVGPWPMNKPRSCWYGDQKCAWFDDCHEAYKGAKAPFVKPEAIRDRSYLSHSFMSNLLDCPEKVRRNEISKEEPSYEMKLGRAFDRGVGEVWKQAFGERCLPVSASGAKS